LEVDGGDRSERRAGRSTRGTLAGLVSELVRAFRRRNKNLVAAGIQALGSPDMGPVTISTELPPASINRRYNLIPGVGRSDSELSICKKLCNKCYHLIHGDATAIYGLKQTVPSTSKLCSV